MTVNVSCLLFVVIVFSSFETESEVAQTSLEFMYSLELLYLPDPLSHVLGLHVCFEDHLTTG